MNLPPVHFAVAALREEHDFLRSNAVEMTGSSNPFRWLVIDGAFGYQQCEAAAAEFPPPDDTGWHTFTGPLEEGKQEARAEIAGPTVAAIHEDLASFEFVTWCEKAFEIPELYVDVNRVGGGIHQVRENGRLGVHRDYNLMHSDKRYMRALNVILFVSDLGDYDHGGWLELWGPYAAEHHVQPRTDRLVIFEATDRSWHGHPQPLKQGIRRSIPAYLFVPRTDEMVPRSTEFLDGDGKVPA